MAEVLTLNPRQHQRVTPLARYISEAADQPFEWGRHDCCTFIAGWAKRITGIDPSEPWRDGYCSEAMAEAILEHGGGIGSVLHGALKPLGFVGVPSCYPGDICIVKAPTPRGPRLCCSLFVGRGRFAMLTQRGLVVGPVPYLMGWRHPNAADMSR